MIPCSADVEKITLLETGEELKYVKTEAGYEVTVPAYEGEEAPIARVFCLKKA